MNADARASKPMFLGILGLLFAASSVGTIAWCGSMSAMCAACEQRMPGGWTLSMTWVRMPGQSWLVAAAGFLGMWTVMMVAMMLPSLVPMLSRYRRAVEPAGGAGRGADRSRLGWLTALVAAGYFFVWLVQGVAVYPLGVTLAEVATRHSAVARIVPVAAGAVVLVAGALQLTRWKARHLACCRRGPVPVRALAANAGTAWRHGLGLGLQCSACCAGLTAVLLVLGAMDLWAMALVTVAITLERLLPAGEAVARALGVVIAGAGVVLIARAVGIG